MGSKLTCASHFVHIVFLVNALNACEINVFNDEETINQ